MRVLLCCFIKIDIYCLLLLWRHVGSLNGNKCMQHYVAENIT
uniref:Uncharacterized protein n=1 Tax=Rhizophora mucronata TaxID=61149 RepID=A0A2P2NQN3_RHIMU